MFQFQVWKKSLDVQYLVESAVVLIMAIIMLTFANLLVDLTKDIDSRLAVIRDLESQTQTADIASKLSAEYTKMGGLSDDYIRTLNSLFVLFILTYSYTFKDLQELLY